MALLKFLGKIDCLFGFHGYARQRTEEKGETLDVIYECPRCNKEVARHTLKLQWKSERGRYFG
jgi:hypothetical protein